MFALLASLVLAAPAGAVPPAPPSLPPREVVNVAYLHDLSTSEGILRLTWASVARDPVHDEVLVVAEGLVRVFNDAGMEVHRFGDDGSLGAVQRAVVLESGEFVVLSTLDQRPTLFRCDYRGDLIVRLRLSGLPPELAGFAPDQLVHRDGRLYLAERGTMQVVVVSADGEFVKHLDLRRALARAVQGDEERKVAASMDGFNVDPAGNVLFTMSTQFMVGRLSPGGELRLFGARGSRPGTFNVVGGVDSDEHGHVFVSDRLRSAISVWDRHLRFLGEFGFRGDGPTNLIAPFELAAGKGRVVVAQAGDRGLKVFQVGFLEAPPPPPDAPTRGQAR